MYRTINDRLREVVLKRQLWAANPLSFNDPFDCALPLQEMRRPEEVQPFVETLLQMDNLSTEHVAQARNAASRGEIFNYDKLLSAWKTAISAIGVTCFCEDPSNILMWSHYALNHQGICLGFEGLHKRLGVQQVKYLDALPQITIADLWSPTLESIIQFVLSKSRHWHYENEWRFILGEPASDDDDPKRGILFYPDELKRVILGCRISTEARENVMSMLGNWPTKIFFYQAERHHSKFKVSLRLLG